MVTESTPHSDPGLRPLSAMLAPRRPSSALTDSARVRASSTRIRPVVRFSISQGRSVPQVTQEVNPLPPT